MSTRRNPHGRQRSVDRQSEGDPDRPAHPHDRAATHAYWRSRLSRARGESQPPPQSQPPTQSPPPTQSQPPPDSSSRTDPKRAANAEAQKRIHDASASTEGDAALQGENPSIAPEDTTVTGDPAHDRGRSAQHPKDIPAPGWRDILLRVWDRLGQDNISLVAAGIAQNTLLAVFPALAVIVSVYGMFSSPADVATDLKPFLDILPGDAAKILTLQLQNITRPTAQALGVGAIFSTLVALWSARQGMAALMTATNIAYHQSERRSFVKQVAISILFTLGGVLGFLIMLVLGVVVPLALKVLPVGPIATMAVLLVRWVLLWMFAVAGLAVVYRYAPDREDAQWRWVTWGSAIAATLWLIGSLLFALYVQNFGSYGKTYGALGGVIVLLMWFYVTAFVIVLGAEINAEMEHQTAVDTTSGPPQPMGSRGAYVADTLGPTPK
jgi:membrane protein